MFLYVYRKFIWNYYVILDRDNKILFEKFYFYKYIEFVLWWKKICIVVMYLIYLNVVVNCKFSFKKSNKGSLIIILVYRGLVYYILN